MDSVFEHIINEVGVRLDELVEGLERPQLFAFLLIKYIKVDVVGEERHVFEVVHQLYLLFGDILVSLLQLLLFFLQGSYFFVNLLFHHLVEVLLLNFQLLHYSAEGFLKTVDLFVELLADLEL